MRFLPEEILVFLGPSLPISEAQAILQARYFPPAKKGDLLGLCVQFKPKVVILIDGYFLQALSVWHKEILFALDKGIHVFGASSMGALRAAETAEFGMVGIGKIFELYHSWKINDDDEVALIHGPAEQGYIPLSLPLINIRFTLEKAKEDGRLSQEICELIFTSAKELHYPERSLEMIIKKVQEKGGSSHLVRECLEEHYVDQKKEDAILVLEKIKTFSSEEDASSKEPFYRTALFEALYHYDRPTFLSSSVLSQRELAHFIALHHPDHAELQYHALNQALVGFLAKILNIEVREEEIEEEKQRFCLRNQLLFLTKEDWAEWFSKNDLTQESFHELIKGRAIAKKLHRNHLIGQVPWKPISYLLNELKLRNQYEEWAEKAAEQQKWLGQEVPDFTSAHFAETENDELLESHLQETNWRPDCGYQKWAKDAGFQDIAELKLEMLKAKLFRDFNKND